jgi:hypothetical protein
LPSLSVGQNAVVAERDRLQFGDLWPLSAAAEDRQVVTQQLAAAAGEAGRAIDQTRSVLLAALGGESSDTAVIYRDDTAD